MVAAGATASLDTVGAWADEETSEEASDQAPASDVEASAPLAGPVAFCEGCAAGCTMVLQVEDGRVVGAQGDSANPLSEGQLCLRGRELALLCGSETPVVAAEGEEAEASAPVPDAEDAAGFARLEAPRVRRAGSDSWEDVSWDMALNEIASLLKDTRDATFEEMADEVPVMRTQAIASFGGGRLTAEEQYLLAKALRTWGIVNIDNEAALGRRAFAAGTKASFGIGEPDGSWADIAHADVVLTVGSDHAESQPLSLRWIERARERGATWIVVDPIRTRTAEMADIHVPLRPGTDIAFLGGLAKYLIDHALWQPEYVLNYTNASYLLDPAFSFDGSTGLFFGWDPMSGTYDKTTWGYQTDGFDTWNMRLDGEFAWVRNEGVPVWTMPTQPKCLRDITLQDAQGTWAHFGDFLSRYDTETVSQVCGVDRQLLERVYETVGATGVPEQAMTLLAGPGLVQHGTGAQASRAAAIVQLLLGNIGVVGGGMRYMGGVPNEIMADAIGLAPDVFAGDLPWPTEDTPDLQTWLEAHTASAGTGSTRPKGLVSALREWWGASAEELADSYGFDWLPKQPSAAPSLGEALRAGTLQGCFLWGFDAIGQAIEGIDARDLGRLSWLVVADGAPNLSAEFWRDAEDASRQMTTVFQLPVAAGPEKAGTRCGASRVMQYADAVVAPFGQSRAEGAIVGELWDRVFNLYDTKGGAAMGPIMNVKWDYRGSGGIDWVKVAWALNGYVIEDTDWSGGAPRLLESPDGLRADGTVACAVGPFAGFWSNSEAPASVDEQSAGRRDNADESGLGLFSGWGFAWPSNVRVRGNRASANLAGQPWVRERNLLSWDGQMWACVDRPDFPVLREGRRLEPDNCAFPGTWERVGLIASDRMDDGPFPEHYEPLESPLNNRMNTSYASPVFMAEASRTMNGSREGVDDEIAAALASDYTDVQVDRSAYPIAAVACGDGSLAAQRALSDTLSTVEPGCFVEMSAALARIRGLSTGDTARVLNGRASVEAPVLVTERITPFVCEDSEVHYVVLNGLNFGGEDEAPCCFSQLAPSAKSPVGAARDLKGFLVDIEKA